MSVDGRSRLQRIGAGAMTGSVGILAGRITGLVRDIVFSRIWGTSEALGAFIMAFTAPNLLRSLFGEGAMNDAFVPLFNQRLEHDGRGPAFALLNNVLTVMTIVLSGIIGLVAAAVLVGRTWMPAGIGELTLDLLPLLMPYALCVCVGAFFAGVLNSFGHFAVPAWSSVVLNVALVAAAAWLCPVMGDTDALRVRGLVVAVLVAGVLQVAMLVPLLRRFGYRFQWRPSFRTPDMRRMLGLLAPGLGGAAVYQVNVLADRMMAGWIGGVAVTSLYYSERLIYMPVGVFAVALTAAVMPAMSRAYAKGDAHESLEALLYAGRHVFYLSLPCVLVLVLLDDQIINLVFRGGAFNAESARATSGALLYYAPGIPAFAALKVVRAGYYSRQDTRTPMLISFGCMLLNVVLNFALMGPLQQRGLALATAISSIVNVTILTVLLARLLRPERSLLLSFGLDLLRQALALAAAAAAILALRDPVWSVPGPALLSQILHVAVPIAAAALAYLAVGFIARSREPRELWGILAHRRRRRAATPAADAADVPPNDPPKPDVHV